MYPRVRGATLTPMNPLPAERSNIFAERISAMWRISNGDLDGITTFEGILAEGAAALRPGHPFVGRLCRLDGDDLVLEYQAFAYCDPATRERFGTSGRRIPLEASAQYEVVREGKTRTWDDLEADFRARTRTAVIGSGLRSLIVTPLRVGNTVYTVAFFSPLPLTYGFEADDVTFVEVLAGYLERRLLHRWQENRIHHQLRHDPLTGLFNRTRFRMLVGEALAERAACGIIVVDIDGLREVNQTHGYQTGDALLVEVGATIGAAASGGEFAARLYGDSFGLCCPGVTARADLLARAADVAAIFSTPFPTGDRDNRMHLPLAASLGIALAPIDGTCADQLVMRAEATLAPPSFYGIGPLSFEAEF